MSVKSRSNSKILKWDLIKIQTKLWMFCRSHCSVWEVALMRQQQSRSQSSWTLFPFIPSPHSVYFGALLHQKALRRRRTKTSRPAPNPVALLLEAAVEEQVVEENSAFLKATVSLWLMYSHVSGCTSGSQLITKSTQREEIILEPLEFF